MMENLLKNYGELLASVDQWFGRCLAQTNGDIHCGQGCSDCCRSLFDITLLDAWYLKSGFDRLDEETRRIISEKARRRLYSLQELWPEFTEPYILNVRPEEDWEELMPDDDETPCPLVSESGECLLYEYRPMTCRLHGIPLVDVSGEVFHDEWCTLNFAEANPLEIKELRWGFDSCFRDEMVIFRLFTHQLFNLYINELDTFIPTALLMDYNGFAWRDWYQKAFR